SSGTAQAVRDVLTHPGVQAGVFALDHETILREGLPIDACDVAVLVRPAQAGSAARRVLIESVAPTGAAVLNAADTNVSEMLCRCPGEAILFSQDAASPLVRDHRRAGGRAVLLYSGALILARGDVETPLLATG